MRLLSYGNIVHVKDWQAEKANEEVSVGWFDSAQATVKCVVGVVLLDVLLCELTNSLKVPYVIFWLY